MKKLITIFLSSIIGICLYGQQKVPMTVVGDVYVGNGGILESDGPVYLQAIQNNSVARLANYGKIQMDSTVFYSNDSIDGLLMNRGTSVASNTVLLRKTFKNSGWYQISFPFDIDLTATTSGVINSATGAPLKINTDFYVAYYDTQFRADTGKNITAAWKQLPLDSLTLRKGVGYRFALDTDIPVGTSVDFKAKNAATIASLYDTGSKGVSLVWFQSKKAGWYGESSKLSEGWNAIGGLNSTLFNIDPSVPTYNYPGTVYYWDDASGDYKGVPDLPVGKTGKLRPYAVIWVQTTSSDVLNYDPTTTSGGFTYNGIANGGGVTVDTAGGVMFRSATASSNDVLGLMLSRNKSAITSDTYLTFNPGFSKYFDISKDNVVLWSTQNPSNPVIWSVGTTTTGNNSDFTLFVNSLPNGENQVSIGANMPVADTYTFSLKEYVNQTIKSAILLDKAKNVQANLLTGNYQITTTDAYSGDDRFVLFINKSVTSIDQISGSPDIYAYTNNNELIVKNLLAGDKVQVLDVTGRTIATGIATGNTFTTALNQKGIYVVNVRGAETKTLKVLNK